jgi:hypothetical protein
MSSSFDTYRDTVLDAARRAGNVPPADLFTRYDIDPKQVRGQDEFAAKAAAVVKFWRSLKQQRKYQQLATAMLAADTDLNRRKKLTLEEFTKQRAENQGRAKAKLTDRIAAVTGSTSCITLSGLHRIMATLDGAFGEPAVRAALAEKGVTVIEPPWDLPAGPPIQTARSLSTPLTALGAQLSPDIVFGVEAVRTGFRLKDGFRLVTDGRTVTLTELHSLRERHSRSKHDERKTAVDTVLNVLITAAEQHDALHRLFLWEVVERLRPDTEAGLPVQAAVDSAVELGLDADEAMQLAVTLAAGAPRTPRTDDTAQQIAQALNAGELTEARSLLADAPPGECTEVRAELEARLGHIADLRRRAEGLLPNDPENAAALLAEALTLVTDDDGLRARLAAIPPPPPAGVTVGIDDRAGWVSIRWAPSPARTPDIRYRVVRTDNAAAVTSSDGSLVAETSSNEASDGIPPAAVPFRYTVFASRGGDTWSVGVAAPPVEWLAAVTDVELRTMERSVVGSWQAHPDMAAVAVTRRTQGADEWIPVPTQGISTFTDGGVRTGVTYEYDIAAVYRTIDGRERRSDSVRVLATPTAPPAPVEELTWAAGERYGSIVLDLAWRPPAAGTVEIRMSQRPMELDVGSVVPRSVAAAIGQPVAGAVSTDAQGRAHLTCPPPNGRVVLTAVTVAGELATIGANTTVSLVDPVSDLKVRRHGDVVRLFWTWPPGATKARVAWWSTATGSSTVPHGEFDTTLQQHIASGGVTFPIRPGAVTVSVCTVAGHRGEDGVSQAVTATIGGERTRVVYAVVASGLPGRRRHDIVLTSEQSCRLPGIIVVHRKDGVLPLRPDSGATIATLPPRELAAGQRVSVQLGRQVRPLSGLACFLDPSSSSADEVTLVPAPSR